MFTPKLWTYHHFHHAHQLSLREEVSSKAFQDPAWGDRSQVPVMPQLSRDSSACPVPRCVCVSSALRKPFFSCGFSHFPIKLHVAVGIFSLLTLHLPEKQGTKPHEEPLPQTNAAAGECSFRLGASTRLFSFCCVALFSAVR